MTINNKPDNPNKLELCQSGALREKMTIPACYDIIGLRRIPARILVYNAACCRSLARSPALSEDGEMISKHCDKRLRRISTDQSGFAHKQHVWRCEKCKRLFVQNTRKSKASGAKP